MRITERFTRQVTEEQYTVSVVDTDGDEVLNSAHLQATDPQSAWEQAVVIAFRACRGSGAVPSTISVRRPNLGNIPI
jgi:hypothetical protein